MAGMYCLNDLLKLAVHEGAEELRVEPGKVPLIVAHGQSRALDLPALSSDEVAELFRSFATGEQREELRRCGDVRFSYSFQHLARFGVTASMDRENISLKMRQISP